MRCFHYSCLPVLFFLPTILYAVEISHVYHQPDIFNPQKNETVKVYFELSENTDVQLNIYDDRDVLVNTVDAAALAKGQHHIEWNGVGNTGVTVPAEAYRYTLTARNSYNEVIEHDLSDHTGGETLHIEDVKWNPVSKQFNYTLHKPARVMIRVGIDGHGPLLVNILNWVPRSSGLQEEPWDGMDASKVLDLTKHPKLKIDIQAYTLSNNTIIVGPYAARTEYIKTDTSPQLRKKKKVKKKRMVSAYQQIPERRGDYLAKLALISDLPKLKNGIPIVNGNIAILLSVDKGNRHVALNQRAEPVFFVDGQFYYENEVGYLPMTWLLDTSKLNVGEHYLTANIRGYEGNFGLATTKIYVERKVNQ